MARPIQADAAATRRRILDIASTLFADRGIGSTTMRAIAGEAGVSMATVHHYFGGKEQLYDTCVERMYSDLSQLSAELLPLFRAGANISQLVATTVARTYAFARRHSAIVRLMLRATVDGGQLERSKREEFLLPFLERGASALAPLVGMSADAVRLVLLSFNHLITRYTVTPPDELMLATSTTSARDAEQAVEEHLVTAALRMLGLPAAPSAQRVDPAAAEKGS